MDNNTDISIIYGHEAKPLGKLETAITRAESGDSEMCYSLASYFLGHEEKAENGSWNVIKRNIEEAVKWAKKCAALGNSNGFAFLGNLYSTGEAALSKYRNLEKALNFYRNGSDMGNLYCSYKLADLLSGNMDSYDDESPYNRDFNEIPNERWGEALNLYQDIYSHLVEDDHKEEVAPKIASCHLALENLKEALEWYKKGEKGEFSSEIQDLKSIIKHRDKIKPLEEKFYHSTFPPYDLPLKIANIYVELSTWESMSFLSEDEFQTYCKGAEKWIRIAKKYLLKEVERLDYCLNNIPHHG